ncbi:MAG TPA: TIGR03067 domain-containing protein [Gemmataceae bacterium]|jgi:uncharacterized protein (TIGR03067 family)|nr:TIGR03067 domain-containing protein [Gemmataceae bacterium]
MTRLLSLLTCLAVPAIIAADDKAKPTKLDGTYTVVSGEHGGKAIPEDQIKGSVVTFTGDRIVGTDKDKKEFFAATYMVDTTAKPMKIVMTSTAPKAGEKAAGIIQVDGDTVKLAYNLPGGEAPTDFKTGEKQHMFVLKRTAK